MKVALAHCYLNQYGGAERVLERLHELFPDAPVYTSIYDPQAMPAHFRSWDIRTSFMQSLPWATRRHQLYLVFYPLAFEGFDLSAYDLVISNSSAWSKSVITPPGTVHICYCLTPMRWAWNYDEYVRREQLGPVVRFFLPAVMTWLRQWDVASASRVDEFIAISRAVAARISKYYRRQSTIIYPPVDCSAFHPAQDHDDYFLVVSRLVPYKRVDLAVQAFTRLGLPLLVVGDGRDRKKLEQMAGPNVTFLGKVPDDHLKELYARCRAFIFPGEEDFGIAPLEAQASGRPVIAYAGGGALDTVEEGVTGLFFHEKDADALAQVVSRFRDSEFDPARCRRQAERFDVPVFKELLTQFVATRTGERVGP